MIDKAFGKGYNNSNKKNKTGEILNEKMDE